MSTAKTAVLAAAALLLAPSASAQGLGGLQFSSFSPACTAAGTGLGAAQFCFNSNSGTAAGKNSDVDFAWDAMGNVAFTPTTTNTSAACSPVLAIANPTNANGNTGLLSGIDSLYGNYYTGNYTFPNGPSGSTGTVMIMPAAVPGCIVTFNKVPVLKSTNTGNLKFQSSKGPLCDTSACRSSGFNFIASDLGFFTFMSTATGNTVCPSATGFALTTNVLNFTAALTPTGVVPIYGNFTGTYTNKPQTVVINQAFPNGTMGACTYTYTYTLSASSAVSILVSAKALLMAVAIAFVSAFAF